MARVDYEAAWHDLLSHIGSKSGHGSKNLIAEAVEIATRNRVSEDLIERVIRVYGRTGLEALLSQSRPEAQTSVASELRARDESPDPGLSKSTPHKEELTDGTRNNKHALRSIA